MTAAEQDAYALAKREFENTATRKEIGDAVVAAENKLRKEMGETITERLKTVVTITKEQWDEVQEYVAQNKEEAVSGKNGKSPVLKIVKANWDKIKSAISGKGDITLRVDGEVGKADTLRSSVTDNYNALFLDGIGQIALPKYGMWDVFRKVPVPKDKNGTIRYTEWDTATTLRAAAAVAEGAQFPESTAKWVTKTMSIEKTGDTIPVSEEFLYDDAMFAAELENFLRVNVMNSINTRLVTGTNVSPDLNGILNQVPAFAAAAAGVQAANVYDLAVLVKSRISTLYGGKYSPDVMIANSTTLTAAMLLKDQNDNYLQPPFAKDGRWNGLLPIEVNQLADNVLIIGDSRFGAIYHEPGFDVEIGLVDKQFIEDMRTMKARKRCNLLIRNIDATGWFKVTSVSDAIATIGQALP